MTELVNWLLRRLHPPPQFKIAFATSGWMQTLSARWNFHRLFYLNLSLDGVVISIANCKIGRDLPLDDTSSNRFAKILQ